jgi:hypothetical protein
MSVRKEAAILAATGAAAFGAGFGIESGLNSFLNESPASRNARVQHCASSLGPVALRKPQVPEACHDLNGFFDSDETTVVRHRASDDTYETLKDETTYILPARQAFLEANLVSPIKEKNLDRNLALLFGGMASVLGTGLVAFVRYSDRRREREKSQTPTDTIASSS